MSIVDTLRKLVTTTDERGRPTSDWIRMTVRKRTRRLVSRLEGPVLDAGGGDGILLHPAVSGRSGEVTILDYNTGELAEARDSYGGKGSFVCGDITGMPFADNVFRSAVCIGTFYNFPNAGAVGRGLKELARVTAPGGRLVLEFRNAGNPLVRFAANNAERYDSTLNGLPQVPYTLDEIHALLKDAGLTAENSTTLGGPLTAMVISFIITAVHREDRDA